ncbi:MAG TPA: hypothetical protein VHI31_03125 [Actinomycetota bacterium]|nr:hypothetical protein [Actinomycetota bacterium]
MKRFQLLALALVVLLAACGDGAAEPTPTASATHSPSASPTASSSVQPTETPSRTSGPSASPASCPAVTGGSEGTDLKLVAVRVGSHAGSDRITFEFAPPRAPSPPNALPKYTVNKVDQVTQDGSGNPVQIGGQALYSLVMQGASGADLSGPQPVITYNGPREFKPNFPALVELEHAGDFENVLSWGIGVKGPRCIKASQLNSPLRLVLDIPHQ